MRPITTALVLSVAGALAGLAMHAASGNPNAPGLPADMAIHQPTGIGWKDGPPSLNPGAKFAVLEGDPSKEGPFTMRLVLPDGFRIMPHTHPKVEHVTVIAGTFNFGMGASFDQSKTMAMPAGSFGHWPAGMQHFAWTKGETQLQLHGVGPWAINYVNPADDPRNAKK